MTPTDSAMTADASKWQVVNDDDGDYEWWAVTDGATSYRCAWEQDAEALAKHLSALTTERTKLAADLARLTTAQPYPVSDIEIELMTLREKVASLEADLARVEGERDSYKERWEQAAKAAKHRQDVIERGDAAIAAAEAKSARLVEALESAEQLKRPIFDFFNGHQPEGDHGFNREWGVAADAANKLHEVLATLTLLERADSLTGERKP